MNHKYHVICSSILPSHLVRKFYRTKSKVLLKTILRTFKEYSQSHSLPLEYMFCLTLVKTGQASHLKILCFLFEGDRVTQSGINRGRIGWNPSKFLYHINPTLSNTVRVTRVSVVFVWRTIFAPAVREIIFHKIVWKIEIGNTRNINTLMKTDRTSITHKFHLVWFSFLLDLQFESWAICLNFANQMIVQTPAIHW